MDGSAPGEPGRPGHEGEGPAGRTAAAERLLSLLEEFRRRQRERPDLAVRPWWTSGGWDDGGAAGAVIVGFVVEYCPRGVDSVELAVWHDRVRVEGPLGLREASLNLASGWRLNGADVRCRELMANHLLSMADRLLGEAA